MALADLPSYGAWRRTARPGDDLRGSVDMLTWQHAGRVTLARSNDGARSWPISHRHRAQRGRMGNRGAAGRRRARSLSAPPHTRGCCIVSITVRTFLASASGSSNCRDATAEFSAAAARPARRSIVFDPHDPMTIYVGVEEGGGRRARANRGESFELLNSGSMKTSTASRSIRKIANVSTQPLAPDFTFRQPRQLVEQVRRGLCRSYTVPLSSRRRIEPGLYGSGGGPPPVRSTGPAGAERYLPQHRTRPELPGARRRRIAERGW